jgi:hypothetical protein
VPINERQRLMLNRLLDGFEGHVTTSASTVALDGGRADAAPARRQLQVRSCLLYGRSRKRFPVIW